MWANATWTTADGTLKERIVLHSLSLWENIYISVLSQGLHDCSQVRGLLILREDSLIRVTSPPSHINNITDMCNSYYCLITIVATINAYRYQKQKHKSLFKKGPQFWMSFLYNSFSPTPSRSTLTKSEKSAGKWPIQKKKNHFLLGTVTRCKTNSGCAQHFSRRICSFS